MQLKVIGNKVETSKKKVFPFILSFSEPAYRSFMSKIFGKIDFFVFLFQVRSAQDVYKKLMHEFVSIFEFHVFTLHLLNLVCLKT